jgi:hypothetical protein
MSRQYNKKSDYWTRFNKIQPVQVSQASYEPKLIGEPFFKEVSQASYTRAKESASSTNIKVPRNGTDVNIGRYSLISQGLLPYEYTKDGVDIRDAIMLCQKAYANVAIVRNTIDITTEFANTDIYLDGGTERSREFFQKWFEKIKLWKLKDQYFREYYRSGNIFLYRIDGKFNAEDFKLLKGLSENGIKNNKRIISTLNPKYLDRPAQTPPIILLSISLNNLLRTPPTSFTEELGTAIHKII